MTNWSDEKANPIADIKKFLELDREIPADFSDETKQAAQHAFAAWESKFIDKLYKSWSIPKEVQEMKFDSGFSLARTALKELEIIRRYENATTGGRRLYEAFLNELYTPKGPGIPMERLRDHQSMGFDGGKERETDPPLMFTEFFGGKRTAERLGIPFDIAIANGIPGQQQREIEVMKPLTPGPTQITDRPEPTINMANYPNKCDCGAPAYRGYSAIECTDRKCKHWVKPKS